MSGRALKNAACVAMLIAMWWWPSTATAATRASSSERTQLLRTAAASEGGKLIGLRVTPTGRATIAPFKHAAPARVVAARSSVDPSWALLVTALRSDASVRQTFLLQRRVGRWRARLWASRGSEIVELCRRPQPGTAVALDLGLRGYEQDCRYRRDRRSLVRRMSASELASVRSMVERRLDEAGYPLPARVPPATAEANLSEASCSWDGDGKATPVSGEVSRADPRWGAVTVPCLTGSDGFGGLENPTLVLVSRSQGSGDFTRPVAHVLMSYSSDCARRAWPAVPVLPRVAFEFCTPFPTEISTALR